MTKALAGRETETARVLAASGVLTVSGDPGLGKTALLDLAAGHAERSGARLLRAAGAPSEVNLAFAVLHQLVGRLPEIGSLPGRQRAALLGAIGLDPEPVAADPMMVGLAVLTLLSDLAAVRPVLVVVDDAHVVDRGSLDALAFAARRLDGEPVTLLFGSRVGRPLDAGDVLRLGPLDDVAANAVLDGLPHPPTGRDRLLVLEAAAGNPLALTMSDDPGLARVLAELPEPTRAALLLASAEPRLSTMDFEVWEPAERRGLIRVEDGRVRFVHPLAKDAVYAAASTHQRREAHLTLAETIDDPDRRAWHLAAVSPEPDEDVAAALEAAAGRASRRGGYTEAATTLERAAELSADPGAAARRLVLAAEAAVLLGQEQWAHDLVAKASSGDLAVDALAALRAGQAYSLKHRYAAAFSVLSQGVRGAEPAVAQEMLATAAVVTYYSGSASRRAELRGLLESVPGDGFLRAWTLAVTDPHASREQLVPRMLELITSTQDQPGGLIALATVAWLIDETPLALELFDVGFGRWRARGPLPAGLGCAAGMAYFEQGRWALVTEIAADSIGRSASGDLPQVTGGALAMDASVAAARGDVAKARELGAEALALIDPLDNTSVVARVRWALGVAAIAEGDYETAFEQLRSLFDADGVPVHYHASYAGIADLAAAAARIGRHRDAARVLDGVERDLAGTASPRITALLHRGRAVLADGDAAEAHYQAGLADPDGAHWAFERGQLLLDHAEWLRRERRVAEARPVFKAALELFRRLGARPWITRTEAELRAAGIEVAEPVPGGLDELTPQQRQIVGFASRGLTNREIGERMFLSPRTVGSHLYRSFPKLGITTRAQLRDLVDSVQP